MIKMLDDAALMGTVVGGASEPAPVTLGSLFLKLAKDVKRDLKAIFKFIIGGGSNPAPAS